MLLRIVRETPVYRATNISIAVSRAVFENQNIIAVMSEEDMYRMSALNRSIPFILRTFFVRAEMRGRQWLRPTSDRLGCFNLWKTMVSLFSLRGGC